MCVSVCGKKQPQLNKQKEMECRSLWLNRTPSSVTRSARRTNCNKTQVCRWRAHGCHFVVFNQCITHTHAHTYTLIHAYTHTDRQSSTLIASPTAHTLQLHKTDKCRNHTNTKAAPSHSRRDTFSCASIKLLCLLTTPPPQLTQTNRENINNSGCRCLVAGVNLLI